MNPNPNPNEQDPTIPAGPNFNPYAPGQGSNPNYSPNPGQNPSTAYGSGQGSNPPYNPYPSYTPNQGQGSNPNYNPYAPTQPGQGSNPPYDPYAPPPGQAPTPSYSPYAPPPQVPPQVPPTPAPSRPSGGRRIGLIVVAAIVILAGIIAAVAGVAIHNNQVANDNATATANAQGTVQAHTTATAQAVATANTVATATAVASTYPFSANVKLIDPLTDNSKGVQWKTNANCAFQNSAYHVLEPNSNFFATCPASSTNFSNFTYQVSMSIVKGDIGGITFRGDDANSKFYTFIVGQDGSWGLFVYRQASSPTVLKSGTSTDINLGHFQSNLIAAVAMGNTISLYVNKQVLATVTDTTYTSGQIGFIGYGSSELTDISFSNAELWSIP